MQEKDTVLEVKNLYKLFGPYDFLDERKAAFKLLELGASRMDVMETTGIMAAISDVSFSVKRGELFVLIGLSGSGKSTIVRCLNMLHKPTKGEILIDGEDITKYNEKQLQELRRTKVSMVFQNGGLLSHRDVLGNVAYGLEVRGVGKEERENKAMEMINMVGLTGYEHEKLSSLSGGILSGYFPSVRMSYKYLLSRIISSRISCQFAFFLKNTLKIRKFMIAPITGVVMPKASV